jgi:dihydrofolate synthase/folylpolyglutamate synthase
MDYSDSISYLFGLQKFGIKLGLENITKLLHHLGNPHKRLRCIHIAGSNGKGSTGAFLNSILKQHGYKAGFYTSPHLIDFTERISIKNQDISKEKVVSLTKKSEKSVRQFQYQILRSLNLLQLWHCYILMKMERIP